MTRKQQVTIYLLDSLVDHHGFVPIINDLRTNDQWIHRLAQYKFTKYSKKLLNEYYTKSCLPKFYEFLSANDSLDDYLIEFRKFGHSLLHINEPNDLIAGAFLWETSSSPVVWTRLNTKWLSLI
jgi:hypothetical protein